MTSIPGRIGIQQRVLPSYRVPFFDALAAACPQGLSVFAGQPRPEDGILGSATLQKAKRSYAANVHRFSGPFYLLSQPNIVEWLENWQPDVLIAEANRRNLSLPGAVHWMHTHRHKVIGWGLGAPQSASAFGGLQQTLRSRFLSQFDALITYSQLGAGQYRAAGFPSERIFVAPNSVAPRPAHAAPQRPEEFKDGKPVVLFVGRLQARKRLELLLQACAALPAALQPRLVIVGDGPERPALKALAGQFYPTAEFTGAKEGAELDAYFDAADLFVLPGTGGLAVQQAMSHALPVIAAEADGTQSDLVRPGNGWQLPPGDLPALIRTLGYALSDVTRLRQMGQASYHIVSEEINLEAMVAAFGRAISAVLSS
jgi:glycosyltransferase involved in cell wall biosynthesis